MAGCQWKTIAAAGIRARGGGERRLETCRDDESSARKVGFGGDSAWIRIRREGHGALGRRVIRSEQISARSGGESGDDFSETQRNKIRERKRGGVLPTGAEECLRARRHYLHAGRDYRGGDRQIVLGGG